MLENSKIHLRPWGHPEVDPGRGEVRTPVWHNAAHDETDPTEGFKDVVLPTRKLSLFSFFFVNDSLV
jgi:hypothetical protein